MSLKIISEVSNDFIDKLQFFLDFEQNDFVAQSQEILKTYKTEEKSLQLEVQKNLE